MEGLIIAGIEETKKGCRNFVAAALRFLNDLFFAPLPDAIFTGEGYSKAYESPDCGQDHGPDDLPRADIDQDDRDDTSAGTIFRVACKYMVSQSLLFFHFYSSLANGRHDTAGHCEVSCYFNEHQG